MVEKDSQLSEHENLKKGLLNFIHSHETLIDYFAIIGFENAQLRRIIHELKVEVSNLHTFAFPPRVSNLRQFRKSSQAMITFSTTIKIRLKIWPAIGPSSDRQKSICIWKAVLKLARSES